MPDINEWLDAERNQLPLWIPAAISAGIIIWEYWGNSALWGVLCLCAGLFLAAAAVAGNSLIGSAIKWGAICVAAGFLAIFLRSASVADQPLQHAKISEFYGKIAKVEHVSARDLVRMELETGGHDGLPRKLRVNLDPEKYRDVFVPGAIVRLRARLLPPAGPSVPGAYDFSRRAWFAQIGATGTVLGDIKLYKPSENPPALASVRRQLTSHIYRQLPPDSGAIAAALVTGERGAITAADEDAMRSAGLTHLLSISGLHVTAVVGAIFLIASRIMSLIPYLALRIRIPIAAAGFAAIGAIAYTLLTGAEVPTVRSCIAAVLVLTALMFGREALSLRLVAFGAVVILLIWPESLAGPSFQLSFAAVTAIITLHDSKWMRDFTQSRDEYFAARSGRGIAALLLTGMVIELFLAPITLYHFHKAGLYGALANVVAIPLTTFVIMPFEALALLFDLVAMGWPFWWVAGQGIELILEIARFVAAAPGAVALLPMMPDWAFGCAIFGALWFGIFKTSARYLGCPVFLAGLAGMITAPYPDILVAGDGKHMAVIDDDGRMALLRGRAGDYIRDTLRENAGIAADPIAIEDWPGARCSADTCWIILRRGGRQWTILAIRSRYLISLPELTAACDNADIVVSERWLPRSCRPKWIKADGRILAQTGGLGFYLAELRVHSVAKGRKQKPWARNASNEPVPSKKGPADGSAVLPAKQKNQ